MESGDFKAIHPRVVKRFQIATTNASISNSTSEQAYKDMTNILWG
jgi:hypothetical protein